MTRLDWPGSRFASSRACVYHRELGRSVAVCRLASRLLAGKYPSYPRGCTRRRDFRGRSRRILGLVVVALGRPKKLPANAARERPSSCARVQRAEIFALSHSAVSRTCPPAKVAGNLRDDAPRAVSRSAISTNRTTGSPRCFTSFRRCRRRRSSLETRSVTRAS